MSTEIHIFTPEGLERFRLALQDIKTGSVQDLPHELLTDKTLATIVEPGVEIEILDFTTTMEMVQYLHPLIEQLALPDKFYNPGLYAWLSAFYFEIVCPIERGVRNPKEDARHIPPVDRNWRKYYRHLIAAPLRIYDTHGMDLTEPLLYGPPSQRTDMLNQIMAVQELAMNPGILEALRLLYWDEGKYRIKRGSADKGLNKPGTLRRFVMLMNQFGMTYDLHAMTGAQIVNLLPEHEFQRWF